MQIVLVRHGQPASLTTGTISGREIGDWVGQYDKVGIVRSAAPPRSVQALVASAGCVVASHLARSLESARWLASARSVRIDPDLREAVVPASMGVPLRLPAGTWLVIARVAWWLNWRRAEESVDATRARARRVADGLCELARAYGTVAVVGHGMFNRFIATQLLERGWRGPKRLPRAYWAAATFARPERPD